MKDVLENFDLFMCDKCGKIVMITDVSTLNQASSHHIKCVCNKEIMAKYNAELKACNSEIELDLIHEKYSKLL